LENDGGPVCENLGVNPEETTGSGEATDTRVIRVFVSSTFRDMQLERDELVKRVFPRLRHLCEQRGVSWSEVDLRWGVTDEQKAEGAVLPICLAEVERTRPYFIGMLGQRYGWVPDEIPESLVGELGWLTEDLGRSVTELEILHGVLNNPASIGHAFFYLRDPAWVEGLEESARSVYLEESATGRKRLDELRERVRHSGHPTSDYSSPEALGARVLADLTELIEAKFPLADVVDAAARVDAVHDAFGRARFGVHVPRASIEAQIDELTRNDGPPVLITGDPGIGVSATATNWARTWATIHPDSATLVHHVDADADAADYRRLAARIITSISPERGTLDEVTAELAAASPTAVRSAVSQACHQVSTSALVVIDGVDRLDDIDGAPTLRWLPTAFPPSVRVVLTTSAQPVRDVVEHRGWSTVEVPPLTADERREIVVAVLAASHKALDREHLDAIAASPHTGNARYLLTVLDELRQHGDHFTLRKLIDRTLAAETVDDLLELVLARYETDFERERPGLTRDVFTALWAARKGLAEAELLDLLGGSGLDESGEPVGRLPHAIWAPLHLAAERGLISRGGLLGFAHRDLRRAVEDRYLSTDASKADAHATLAAYFLAQPLSPRVADELAWQQAEAGDIGGLRASLADLEYVELAYRRNPGETRRLWTRLAGSSGSAPGDDMALAYRQVLDDPAAHDEARADPASDQRAEPRQLVWGIARLLTDAGNVEAAIGLHRHLVDSARHAPAGSDEGPDGTGRLRASLINLGAAELVRGNLDAAGPLFEEAVALCRKAGDDAMLADGLGNLAITLRDQGQSEAAVAAFWEAEQLCRHLNDDDGLQAVLGNHAQLLREAGRFDAAFELLREQEDICRHLADPVAVGRALAGLAAIRADRGDPAGALVLMERHAELARTEGDLRGLAEAQLNVAATRNQLGDSDLARVAADEAELVARRFGDAGLLARILVVKATVLGQTARWADAERVGREAELTARNAGLTRQVALALGVVGTARREQGDLVGARAAHEDEIASAESTDDELASATARVNLANVLVAEQRYDEALEPYTAALDVFRRLDVPSSMLPVLANRGQLHQLANRVADALADLTDAAEVADRIGADSAASQWAEPALALAYQSGDTARAERLWTVMANVAERSDDQTTLQRALGERALMMIGRAQQPTGIDQAVLDEAADVLDRQEKICRRIGDDVGLAACLGNQAIVARYRNDLERSLTLIDDQLSLATSSNNAQGVLFATANRGEVLGLLGRKAEGVATLEEAKAMALRYDLAPMAQQLDQMIAALRESG
jgi:tetratricopeptide (TPR) repeat protein